MKKDVLSQVLNSIIVLLGLALVVRSIFVLGAGSLSVGLIMGLLFLLFGTVRLYTAARRRRA